MLMFMVFVMPILLEQGFANIIILNVLFLVLYFIGIFSSKERWSIYLSSLLFFAHLILQLIRFDDTPKEYYLIERLAGLINMSQFILINIRLLFRDTNTNKYRIIGAINVYLLFALMGAFAFEILRQKIRYIYQSCNQLPTSVSLKPNDESDVVFCLFP